MSLNAARVMKPLSELVLGPTGPPGGERHRVSSCHQVVIPTAGPVMTARRFASL